MRRLGSFTVRAAMCVAAALALGGCAAPVVRSGLVAGRVVLPARSGDVRDAVVWAEPAPIAGPVARGMRRPRPVKVAAVATRDTATMAALAGRFEPHVLAIAPGGVVRFENRDRLWHQVIGRSAARTFDAGACAPGRSRFVTFDRAGAVPVFCELDRSLSGWVYVAADACIARPDPSGAFELRLPPGAYTVRAWHPTAGTRARPVVFQGADASITLQY